MRKLPAELKRYFDSKCPVTPLSPTGLLIEAVASCVGIKEIGGNNQGPMVSLFQESIDIAESQPWCLDFLQACIAWVENVMAIQSPLAATQGVVDLWNRSKSYQATNNPKPGDLILWQFEGTQKGHCGILTGSDSLTWSTIEGNTSSNDPLDRDGDGVYAKKRAKGGSKTFVELGFLRVFDVSSD